jgi:hypothetical protein
LTHHGLDLSLPHRERRQALSEQLGSEPCFFLDLPVLMGVYLALRRRPSCRA